MRKYHPDTNHSVSSDQKAKEINAAYEVLKIPLSRREYDAKLNQGKARASAPPPPPTPPPPPPTPTSAKVATGNAPGTHPVVWLLLGALALYCLWLLFLREPQNDGAAPQVASEAALISTDASSISNEVAATASEPAASVAPTKSDEAEVIVSSPTSTTVTSELDGTQAHLPSVANLRSQPANQTSTYVSQSESGIISSNETDKLFCQRAGHQPGTRAHTQCVANLRSQPAN